MDNVVELRKPVKTRSYKDSAEWLAFYALDWVNNRLEDYEDNPFRSLEQIVRGLPEHKRVLEQLVEAIKAEAAQ
jgi:hypothetical protein